ncbi:hypothetical protein GE061_016468 [Apolygus lucorum]|uniref:SAP domain-containing protein n=1 Tax=Apolygus lucorum TaxID=248454 RepID=A0A8S9XHD6_APOLU|nr:hypothetical protein GE061_016468 [Apolygus lucorum]
MNPSTMRVAQLKEELKNRSLKTTGKKSDLIKRLEAAIEVENSKDEGDDEEIGEDEEAIDTDDDVDESESSEGDGELQAIKRIQPTSKLRPKFVGPSSVATVKPNNTYEADEDVDEADEDVDGPRTTTTWAELMKPWSDHTGRMVEQNGRVVGSLTDEDDRSSVVK